MVDAMLEVEWWWWGGLWGVMVDGGLVQNSIFVKATDIGWVCCMLGVCVLRGWWGFGFVFGWPRWSQPFSAWLSVIIASVTVFVIVIIVLHGFEIECAS